MSLAVGQTSRGRVLRAAVRCDSLSPETKTFRHHEGLLARHSALPAKDFSRQPHWSYEDVNGIGEKGGLIALDKMAEPGQSERRWNEQQCDDPMPPDHDERGKADRYGDHVQSTIDRMVMRAVVMRVKSHIPTPVKRGFNE